MPAVHERAHAARRGVVEAAVKLKQWGSIRRKRVSAWRAGDLAHERVVAKPRIGAVEQFDSVRDGSFYIRAEGLCGVYLPRRTDGVKLFTRREHLL